MSVHCVTVWRTGSWSAAIQLLNSVSVFTGSQSQWIRFHATVSASGTEMLSCPQTRYISTNTGQTFMVSGWWNLLTDVGLFNTLVNEHSHDWRLTQVISAVLMNYRSSDKKERMILQKTPDDGLCLLSVVRVHKMENMSQLLLLTSVPWNQLTAGNCNMLTVNLSWW